ncbi:MAG: UDP-glucose 4-epimerase GalE [Blastocatellia bacterium AA13]|nr:MAG: UDP-glucose 4-epimerase GalE [Blastocatellia bacterium AA13]
MILVTGGAGYIGSVTVERLLEAGEEVVVLDNLFRGHREAVPSSVPFYRGNIGDIELVARITRAHSIDACIHFAALAYVGESVSEPSRYFENNVEQGSALLRALLGAGVRQIVFSSTCAVYGEPREIPISEQHPQQPVNPYGWSKLFMERMLEGYDKAHSLRFVALRYFNAAGATEQHGERHQPETHLIPNVLSAAIGSTAAVDIFGNDYPTPDGTPVRDYVHVADLAAAHLLSLRYLSEGGCSQSINLGNGNGYSVLEVIETARAITERPIPVRSQPARCGDPSILIADATKARELLGWSPRYSELSEILRSDWEWRIKNS